MQKNILIGLSIGFILGVTSTYLLTKEPVKDNNALIADFYATENAVHVSPHSLRSYMSKGQVEKFVLVDLRSQEEYETAHIVTALNVPAYKDPNTSAYDETERIIGAFKAIIKENPGKDIIVYCYSTPCMTGRKIGLMLAEAGIYVKHLGIGWNDWRYDWNAWNHDGETPTKMEDYITTGTEPGLPPKTDLVPSCTEGAFGC
jgi:rhodanese-related sulfurtransferase